MDTIKKLRFEKGSDAIARNAKAAEDKNCDMLETQAWFGYFKDEKGFYLEVKQEDYGLLTQEELGSLED